jgi:hypothetical protein
VVVVDRSLLQETLRLLRNVLPSRMRLLLELVGSGTTTLGTSS